MTSISFLKTHTIRCLLEVKTGLRVGAGKDSVEIGGIDSPVVKHPHTQEPYIPGSSIKGKLRSLLEWALDCIEENGDVYGSGRGRNYPPGDVVLRTFGLTSDKWNEGPSRLIVRDAHLDKEWARSVVDRGLPLTEAKQEVTINRIEGKAAQMGPRTMERVPAGARFEVEILFKRYSVDDDHGAGDLKCLNRVIEALRLLEQDALGGSGSRGYGRVEFSQMRIDGQDITSHFREMTAFDKKSPFPFVTE